VTARWPTLLRIGVCGVVVVVLALAPSWATLGQLRNLVELLTLLTLAQMWNLLAGYAGLVSIGQQAYIGIGAYAFYALGDKASVHPYLAVLLAGLIAGAISLPSAALVFRLRAGYFAIGTWVVAEVFHLLVLNSSSLGGGAGVSILFVSDIERRTREFATYWMALGLGLGAIALAYVLLRSRTGLALTAIRDNEEGAEGVGVNVLRSKVGVYVIAALGCGLAGAVTYLSLLRIQPDAAFTVNWTAFMIFIVVIGGLGTLEGPIIGTVIFYVLQQQFSSYGVWYLVALGVVAVAFAVWVPRGIWGWIAERYDVHLFPLRRRFRGVYGDTERHVASMTTAGGGTAGEG
jgi:branched-chain amino acid transport system permease protein